MKRTDEAEEETPLLSSSSSTSETLVSFPEPRPNLIPRSPSYIPHIHTAHSPRTIIAIIFTILFILNFGGFLMSVPGIRIYEDIICHHYYAGRGEGQGFRGLEGDIDEDLCKGMEVQNELSLLLAGLQVIGAFPALIVTIPYGFLADRIGRKPVFILAIIGILLSFIWTMVVMWFWQAIPLRWVWLGPIFQLLGGGETVTAMTFYAIACDITSEAGRATVFSLGVSAGLVAEVMAPSIATYLMKTSNWLPMFLGLAILGLGTILTLFIPETLHMRPRASNTAHLTPSPSNLDLLPENTPDNNKNTPILSAMKHEFGTALRTLTSSIEILSSTPTLLLVLTFIIQPFCRQSTELVLRYTSTRFEFKLRYASLLISLRAAINVLLLLVLLPSISYFLTKRLSFTSPKKDFFLAKSSILFLTTGTLIIAASPTLSLAISGMAVFALGTGYFPLARSLLTSLVHQKHIAQLYSQIGVIEVIGALVSGPSLAKLYMKGLEIGGAWAALPFFAMGVICLVAAVGIWIVGWIMGKKGWRDAKEGRWGENAVLIGAGDVDEGEVGIVNGNVVLV